MREADLYVMTARHVRSAVAVLLALVAVLGQLDVVRRDAQRPRRAQPYQQVRRDEVEP
ncbi:hypothetical protein [Streptomyces sp. MMG1522]|uniref:hypothetical protein n=1 Tax=Streptomyces sp. MMG1522 TaxID=1415545 RepID=UPI001F3EA6C3|nr:hypothetical protein [Streptomyces sp. MMG1522]